MIFLVLLFVFVFLLYLINLGLISVSFFTTFYVWNLVFKLPKLREQAMKRRYRFSFLRQIFRIDDLMAIRSPQINPIVRRQLPPITLMLVAFGVTYEPGVFFGLVGGLLMEGLYEVLRGQNNLFQHFKKFDK